MIQSAYKAVGATTYPGRGIIVGKSADGKRAVMAYFIMGRSENSRNRIFVQEPDGIRTEAFDPSKMVDPSLIIYWPVRVIDDCVIITNGDQTDDIFNYIDDGAPFADALRERTFEPDAPNFTPRVSAMAAFVGGDFSLDMAILRAGDAKGSFCHRVFWEYEQVEAGKGCFLHTYLSDGNPIPSFTGGPETVAIDDGDAEHIAETLWNGLNADNRVSLWVCTRDLATGRTEQKIVNRNS